MRNLVKQHMLSQEVKLLNSPVSSEVTVVADSLAEKCAVDNLTTSTLIYD